MSTTRWRASGGTLAIAGFDGSVKAYDPLKELDVALENIGAGVLNLPRAYAGMVSRELVQRIAAKHGALFGGVSPDIYSAALIAMECKSSYRIDFPIIIPGASGGSTSGQSARGQHAGGLRDNAHIGAFKDLQWDARVPEYYSVPTVWGYSLLKAIEHLPDQYKKVNLSRLYVKCMMANPHYHKKILACMGLRIREIGVLRAGWELSAGIWREFLRVATILVNKARRAKVQDGSSIELSAVSDTESGLASLLQHLRDRGIELKIPAVGAKS